MAGDQRAQLQAIRTFPQLVRYLRDELGWPVDSDAFDDMVFEYTPEELGIASAHAAAIQEIKRLRPLVPNQPWGIFIVKFEPKRLPVVALRRILSQVVIKKRATARAAELAAWQLSDLLFISNYGDRAVERRISLAYFSQSDTSGDLPMLKVLGWDGADTNLHLDSVAAELHSKLHWPADTADVAGWRSTWAAAFTVQHGEIISTAKRLAVRLAELARGIRAKAVAALAIESEAGPLRSLLRSFRDALLHDLDEEGFADMYAQTIAYGLLTARISRPQGLIADNLADMVPVTNPFLKEMLETFVRMGGRRKAGRGSTGIDFDELGVNDVVQLLRAANMEAVVRDFGDKNPQEDPVIHFYELFLKEYDAKKRMQRGVFYTPRPVVSYIVRSVDELLRSEFGLEDGLADTTTWGEMAKRQKDLKIPEGTSPDQAFVQILDPATGTGTFLVEVIDIIHKTMVSKWTAQGHVKKKILSLWNEYVPEHLLTRLHAYELLMAPYAIAHLKVGLKLHETGYRFGSDERVRIYLTNALEPAQDFSGTFEFAIPALAHEAEAVNKIKRKHRFTVVIGNPPYSNFGKLNKTAWILSLIDDYKSGLNERKINIDDDYIKFIRFTHYVIQTTGTGVVSMITNNSYLDGVTHRKMRHDFLLFFDRCFILNLHGNLIKNEGDDNVFDIRVGVGISTFVKCLDSGTIPLVHYLSTLGHELNDRDSKYRFLINTRLSRSDWHTISPAAPWFWFVPKADGGDQYEHYWGIEDIFRTHSVGIKTKIDSVAIDFDATVLGQRIHDILKNHYSIKELAARYDISKTTTWEYDRAQKAQYSAAKVIDYDYRPFDVRKVYYDNDFLSRSRSDVMDNFVKRRNVGLEVGRLEFIAFVSRRVSDEHLGGGCSYKFPLWIYPKGGSTLWDRGSIVKPNFSDKFRHFLETAFTEAPLPETILGYIFAILHSNKYREQHADQFSSGFPRVPFVFTLDLFRALASVGSELVALHLLESPKVDHFITTYTGPKNPEVGRVGWSVDTVWLDAAATKKGQPATPGTIGFRGVPEAVWNFHIGGYQVCEKWLKDRKGRTLSKDDIAHYQRIVVALSETIRLMGEIDAVIEQHGGWPGAFAAKS